MLYVTCIGRSRPADQQGREVDAMWQVETTHAMLEHVTYQMNTMDKDEAMIKLGGTTALLKAHSTKVLEYCAREAAQIFGGASYVRGGQGEKIERIYREVRAFAIPGGSEEVNRMSTVLPEHVMRRCWAADYVGPLNQAVA